MQKHEGGDTPKMNGKTQRSEEEGLLESSWTT